MKVENCNQMKLVLQMVILFSFIIKIFKKDNDKRNGDYYKI